MRAAQFRRYPVDCSGPRTAIEAKRSRYPSFRLSDRIASLPSCVNVTSVR